MYNISDFVRLYKNMRGMARLRDVCRCSYAFVGIGRHSTDNLYPVLDYLHVPLKYVCCRSETKARLITDKFRDVAGTVSLDDILNDDAVKGVFVAVTPAAHYDIAMKVLSAGKALFIEKPPCMSSAELGMLAGKAAACGSPVVVTGMQKRYAPVTKILSGRLRHEGRVSYNMKYLTGLYPEGDALAELFIHPLDYVCFLFGRAVVKGAARVAMAGGGETVMLVLEHERATGMLELSTAYTWGCPAEGLTVNTKHGVYKAEQMERLEYMPKHGALFGVPFEKVMRRNPVSVCLFGRNNFVPTMINNQIFTQGYYDEIKAFVDAVEGRRNRCCSSFGDMAGTYALIDAVRRSL